MINLFRKPKHNLRRMAQLGANGEVAAKSDNVQAPAPSRTRPPSQQVAASAAHTNRLGPAVVTDIRPQRSA